MNKSIVIQALSLVLILSLLTACGETPENSVKNTDESNAKLLENSISANNVEDMNRVAKLDKNVKEATTVPVTTQIVVLPPPPQIGKIVSPPIPILDKIQNSKISYYKNKMDWCGPSLPYKERPFRLTKENWEDGITTVLSKVNSKEFINTMNGDYTSVYIELTSTNSPKSLRLRDGSKTTSGIWQFQIGNKVDDNITSTAYISDADSRKIIDALSNGASLTFKLFFIGQEPVPVGSPGNSTSACRIEVL